MTNPRKSPKNDSRREERDNDDLCWGRNPVTSLLENDPSRCAKVFLSKTMQRGPMGRIADLCRKSGVHYSQIDSKAMDSMTNGAHQGVIAVVASSRMLGVGEAISILPEPPLSALAVLLDHVQDPRNVGAMIRSAEAASASFVAMPLRRNALPTGTVAKTSAGASLRVPLVSVGNVAAATREFQDAGLWTVGLDEAAARTIYSAPLPPRTLLVVGGEGKGLGRTTITACDETLRIPIKKETGSLNASIALSVAMFEWLRVNEIT